MSGGGGERAAIDQLCREGRHAEAAELCLAAGDPLLAADLFAAVWEWPRAIAAAEGAGRLDEAYRHALAAEDRSACERLFTALVSWPEQALAAAAHAEARSRLLDAARLHEVAGDVAAAAALFERGGELFEAARCRESEGRYRDAGILYERRLRESPDDAESALRLGRILAHFGRYEHAVRALQSAARDGERAGSATRLLVGCFAAMGMDDAAASRLDELRRDDPALPVTIAEFLEESFGDTRGLPALLGAGTDGAEEPQRLLAGRYRVVRPLGAGASGRVLLAHDVFYDREVAVKVLSVGAGGVGRDAFVRFAREARVAAGMSHPNVVRVFDFNPDGPFLVMEHMEGGTLEDRLGAPGEARRMALPAVRAVMVSVLAALEAVHRRGVVHRDLKPANVFYGAAGEVKLGDFGVAHLADLGATLTGALLGTLAYMAPEQITGSARPEAATDVYALGVILYRALTGHLPFAGPDFVTQHLQETPRPPSAFAPELGIAYDAALAAFLEKDAERRPRTASEALGWIERLPFLDPSTGAMRPRSEPPEARAPSMVLATPVSERYAVEHTLPDGAQVARDTLLRRAVRIVRCDGAEAARLRRLAAADSPFLQAVLDLDDEAQLAILEEPSGETLAGLALDPGGRAAVRAAVHAALRKLHATGLAHGRVDAAHVRVAEGRAVLLLPEASSGGTADEDLQALERLV